MISPDECCVARPSPLEFGFKLNALVNTKLQPGGSQKCDTALFSRSEYFRSVLASASTVQCVVLSTYRLDFAELELEFGELFKEDSTIPTLVFHGDRGNISASDLCCSSGGDEEQSSATSASVTFTGTTLIPNVNSTTVVEGHKVLVYKGSDTRQGHSVVVPRHTVYMKEVVPKMIGDCSTTTASAAAGAAAVANSGCVSSSGLSPQRTAATAAAAPLHTTAMGVHHPKYLLIFTDMGLHVIITTANISRKTSIDGTWHQFFPRWENTNGTGAGRSCGDSGEALESASLDDHALDFATVLQDFIVKQSVHTVKDPLDPVVVVVKQSTSSSNSNASWHDSDINRDVSGMKPNAEVDDEEENKKEEDDDDDDIWNQSELGNGRSCSQNDTECCSVDSSGNGTASNYTNTAYGCTSLNQLDNDASIAVNSIHCNHRSNKKQRLNDNDKYAAVDNANEFNIQKENDILRFICVHGGCAAAADNGANSVTSFNLASFFDFSAARDVHLVSTVPGRVVCQGRFGATTAATAATTTTTEEKQKRARICRSLGLDPDLISPVPCKKCALKLSSITYGYNYDSNQGCSSTSTGSRSSSCGGRSSRGSSSNGSNSRAKQLFVSYGMQRVKDILLANESKLPRPLGTSDELVVQPTSIGMDVRNAYMAHFLSHYMPGSEWSDSMTDTADSDSAAIGRQEAWRMVWPTRYFMLSEREKETDIFASSDSRTLRVPTYSKPAVDSAAAVVTEHSASNHTRVNEDRNAVDYSLEDISSANKLFFKPSTFSLMEHDIHTQFCTYEPVKSRLFAPISYLSAAGEGGAGGTTSNNDADCFAALIPPHIKSYTRLMKKKRKMSICTLNDSPSRRRNNTNTCSSSFCSGNASDDDFEECLCHDVAWCLLTSACLSKGAQGQMIEASVCTTCRHMTPEHFEYRNFELGVMFHSSSTSSSSSPTTSSSSSSTSSSTSSYRSSSWNDSGTQYRVISSTCPLHGAGSTTVAVGGGDTLLPTQSSAQLSEYSKENKLLAVSAVSNAVSTAPNAAAAAAAAVDNYGYESECTACSSGDENDLFVHAPSSEAVTGGPAATVSVSVSVVATAAPLDIGNIENEVHSSSSITRRSAVAASTGRETYSNSAGCISSCVSSCSHHIITSTAELKSKCNGPRVKLLPLPFNVTVQVENEENEENNSYDRHRGAVPYCDSRSGALKFLPYFNSTDARDNISRYSVFSNATHDITATSTIPHNNTNNKTSMYTATCDNTFSRDKSVAADYVDCAVKQLSYTSATDTRKDHHVEQPTQQNEKENNQEDEGASSDVTAPLLSPAAKITTVTGISTTSDLEIELNNATDFMF